MFLTCSDAKTTMAAIRPILTVVAIVLGCSPTTAEESILLDRNYLLQYRDASGKVQRVATPAAWQACRAGILRGMQEVMGKLPGEDRRVPLEVEVQEEAEVGTYVRRLITYQSEPGARTPAYLCIPKEVLARKREAPAVLCLHPTDNQVGKVVVGLGGRPGRQYAAELAERGYSPVPLLSAPGGLLAEPRPARLRQRHDESDLGQFPRSRSARRDPLCGRLARLRRDRPFLGRPQRDLHRRVRPTHHRCGQQLRV